MRVARKGEVSTSGLDSQGGGAEAVKAGKPTRVGEGIAPAKGEQFVERLFSSLVGEIQGSLETLQTRVDESAAALVAQPNQLTLDSYKEAVAHLLAFIIDKSVTIERVQSLKRGKDGKPKEYVRVEIVNEKLAELAKDVMGAQKPMLDLVHRMDEIRGILVDLYDWKSTK